MTTEWERKVLATPGAPERVTAIEEELRRATDYGAGIGLYDKYRVERIDGKGMTLGCFVLEFDDPKAWDALLTYAQACDVEGLTALASDLRKRVLAIIKVITVHRAIDDRES